MLNLRNPSKDVPTPAPAPAPSPARTYSLNPLFKLLFKNDRSVLLCGPRNFLLKDLSSTDIDFLERISKEPFNLKDVAITSSPELKKVIEKLECVGALQEVYPVKIDLERARQISYMNTIARSEKEFAEAIEKIDSETLLILGCGGTGSIVAQNLVGLGFKKFVLLDFDIVDPSNLNRQYLFSPKDVGSLKVSCLEKRLLEQNPRITTAKLDCRLETKDQLVKICRDHGVHTIISCIDTPPVICSQMIAEATLQLGLRCAFAGVGFEEATIGPTMANSESLRAFIAETKKTREVFDIEKCHVLSQSLGSTNGIVSSILAHEIFLSVSKLKKPRTENKKCKIVFPSYEVETIRTY